MIWYVGRRRRGAGPAARRPCSAVALLRAGSRERALGLRRCCSGVARRRGRGRRAAWASWPQSGRRASSAPARRTSSSPPQPAGRTASASTTMARSPRRITALLDELDQRLERDVPAERVAAAGQLLLPVQAEVAAVDDRRRARSRRGSRGSAARAGQADPAARLDGPRVAVDRQLAGRRDRAARVALELRHDPAHVREASASRNSRTASARG